MIRLDSLQTLAAVRRSLETHVLPALDDDFARLQVRAALQALADVADRIERGDPIERSNQRLRDGLTAIAESAGGSPSESGAASGNGSGNGSGAETGVDAVLALVARADAEDDPRQRAHLLRTGARELLGTNPLGPQILVLCQQEASLVSMEEAPWMCAEAIESLQ